MTNNSQSVTRTYQHDEWGQLVGGTDPGGIQEKNQARFKGALWEGPDLDLYYMRNRWYEPKTGRFLSEDPIGLDGGINIYAFGASDPINSSDPTGTEPCTLWQKWIVTYDKWGPDRKEIAREEDKDWRHYTGDCMPGDDGGGDSGWWMASAWGWGPGGGNQCTGLLGMSAVLAAENRVLAQAAADDWREYAAWVVHMGHGLARYEDAQSAFRTHQNVDPGPVPRGAIALVHSHGPLGYRYTDRFGRKGEIMYRGISGPDAGLASSSRLGMPVIAREPTIAWMVTPSGNVSGCGR